MEKQDALAALAALAHQTRLEVFRILVKAGPDGLAAGAIADELGIPSATLSFHLKELKSADVVLRRRDSRSLYYSANFDVMNALLQFLTLNCCEGVAACDSTPLEERRS